MIKDLIIMNGYGVYVWFSFGITVFACAFFHSLLFAACVCDKKLENIRFDCRSYFAGMMFLLVGAKRLEVNSCILPSMFGAGALLSMICTTELEFNSFLVDLDC